MRNKLYKAIRVNCANSYFPNKNYPRQKNAQSEAISILSRQRLSGDVICMRK